MSDLSSVVLVLKAIEKELSWFDHESAVFKLLKELESINSNIEQMNRRLKDIENELARK